MPITRKQFDMGIDNEIERCMGEIRNFLAEHKDEAFETEELYRVCYKDGWILPGTEKAVDEALYNLVQQSVVEKKKIRDVYYYSWIE